MGDNGSRRCLNCGTPIVDGGKYCHECGQTVLTERLTMKNFAVGVFLRLTRLNKGVVFTCYNLLVRPWQVIADYIRGQRVKYTDPVQLLLVLTFLTVALGALFEVPAPAESHGDFRLFGNSTFFGNIGNAMVRMFLTSTVIQYLVVFIPAVPMLMLVNRRKGDARYNLAEYLLAAIYMSDAVLVFQLLVKAFDALLPTSTVFLTYPYILAVGSYGVYKSLGHLHLSRARRVLRVLVFLASTLMFYILILAVSVTMVYLLFRNYLI